MRTWYKFYVKLRDNPKSVFQDDFALFAAQMDHYKADQGYDSREAYFSTYLTERLLFYDVFLRQYLIRTMHTLSVASGRAVNELALIQDGFDITCSDLGIPDCITASNNLFGDFAYKKIDVLGERDTGTYDAVICLSLIYNFDDIQLQQCFASISGLLTDNGVLVLDYAGAPDNMWSQLLHNVYLPVEAMAYAIFRTIRDRRLYRVVKIFHGYRRTNQEIEKAAKASGLTIRAYDEGCELMDFSRGYSKHASEQYVEEYQRRYGLDYTVLRYGSLYGPRSDQHNGLWRIVKKALETGIVSYEGSPEAMREYIHVADAARASVIALGDEFRNQHVVLTGQEPMRVVDLLKMLAEILGMPQSVDFIKTKHAGHYIRTPYAYQTSLGRKYVSSLHVDLGQGLLELIGEIKKEF